MAAIREVLINWSVIPPNADTTTITGSPADSTIFFTLKMLFTEPTDVPPNFITFMKILILMQCPVYSFTERLVVYEKV